MEKCEGLLVFSADKQMGDGAANFEIEIMEDSVEKLIDNW